MSLAQTYSFRLETKQGGVAHAVGPAAPYAACGVMARGITVSEGTPCPRCLAAIAEREAA